MGDPGLLLCRPAHRRVIGEAAGPAVLPAWQRHCRRTGQVCLTPATALPRADAAPHARVPRPAPTSRRSRNSSAIRAAKTAGSQPRACWKLLSSSRASWVSSVYWPKGYCGWDRSPARPARSQSSTYARATLGGSASTTKPSASPRACPRIDAVSRSAITPRPVEHRVRSACRPGLAPEWARRSRGTHAPPAAVPRLTAPPERAPPLLLRDDLALDLSPEFQRIRNSGESLLGAAGPGDRHRAEAEHAGDRCPWSTAIASILLSSVSSDSRSMKPTLPEHPLIRDGELGGHIPDCRTNGQEQADAGETEPGV